MEGTCNEASSESEAWLVLLNLNHQLVNVDQLRRCRYLREGGHTKYTAESAVTFKIIINRNSQYNQNMVTN